jgi:hypothetical protein
MPTWGSLHDHEHGGGFLRTEIIDKEIPSYGAYLERSAIMLTKQDGTLKSEVAETIHVAKERSMAISTGHVSPQEALALAHEAAKLDYKQLWFGHPLSPLGARLAGRN